MDRETEADRKAESVRQTDRLPRRTGRARDRDRQTDADRDKGGGGGGGAKVEERERARPIWPEIICKEFRNWYSCRGYLARRLAL